MSSEKKYINSNYEDFFEKSLSKSDPELFKAINDELIRKHRLTSCIRSSRFCFN